MACDADSPESTLLQQRKQYFLDEFVFGRLIKVSVPLLLPLQITLSPYALLDIERRRGGVDPVSWTPEDVQRSPRWERVKSDIRRSCRSSSCAWSEVDEAPRSCL